LIAAYGLAEHQVAHPQHRSESSSPDPEPAERSQSTIDQRTVIEVHAVAELEREDRCRDREAELFGEAAQNEAHENESQVLATLGMATVEQQRQQVEEGRVRVDTSDHPMQGLGVTRVQRPESHRGPCRRGGEEAAQQPVGEKSIGAVDQDVGQERPEGLIATDPSVYGDR
jgi:hypothetical protein